MTRRLQYLVEGWRPAGPGGCRCPKCGATITTNALGRASHRQACKGWREFRDKLAEARKIGPRMPVQEAIRRLGGDT